MKLIHRMREGFTLLEVLIVIAIIGILVSIGLASYSTAQSKSRDARRRGDLKAIQNAFEQYYAESANAAYPTTCSSIAATYLPAGIPTDPQGDPYINPTCTATAYCFCADMESSAADNSDANCNYGAATKTHFCVSQLQ